MGRNDPGRDRASAHPYLTPVDCDQATTLPWTVQSLLRSGGQPLDPAARSLMERRLGHNFGNVRVHADAAAADANRVLAARAFTSGRHIAFNAGEYRPGTAVGRALIAHELAHVLQQRNHAPVLQRQPKEQPKKSKFDLITADVEGQEQVVAVASPTDPADFLKAFEEKGNEFIGAESKWLSNNLLQFVADGVKTLKRNPFAGLGKEDILAISRQAYEKAVGALAVKAASKAASAILKIINIGKKATGVIRGIGGIVSLIVSAAVQGLIGTLYDKTNALVRQAIDQFAEGAKKVANDVIIPQAISSAAQFTTFMATLKQYMLQDDDTPQAKMKNKGGVTSFSVGEGEYKATIQIDMNVPLTESRLYSIMVDLGNAVLGIDEVVPKLETDLSLYEALALKAGVFTGDVAMASPAPEPAPGKPSAATQYRPFRVEDTLYGEKKFDVPKGFMVVIRSEARYDTEEYVNVVLPDKPWLYSIELRREGSGGLFHTDREQDPRLYQIDKSEIAAWYNLHGGQYYVVIKNLTPPYFVVQGNLTIEVRKP
jgi:hypothetical protein